MTYIILAVLIAVIFIKISNLDTKIKILESELFNLKKEPSKNQNTQSSPIPTPIPLSYTGEEQAKIVEVKRNIEEQLEAQSKVSSWFKENIILKIGVLMLLAGFGWFVSYAFIHDWIGPVGRVVLGVSAGFLALVFGTMRLVKNKVQGITFTILGSSLIVVSMLAGQYFYQFFSPNIVLFIVFVVSMYVSISAVYRSYEELAVFGLIMSMLAPYLSHTSNMDLVLLFSYLFIVSITTIWISISKNWRTTTFVGLTAILFYSLPIYFGLGQSLGESKYIILAISYLISLLYLLVNMFSLVKNNTNINGTDIYLTIVNALISVWMTTTIISHQNQSMFILIWALFYAISALIIFWKTGNDKMFFIHSLTAVLLLGIATSIEYSGKTMVIAFILESTIIPILSFVVTKKAETARNYTLLVFIPFILSLQSLISSKWNSGTIFHSDFAILLLMSASLLVLGILFTYTREEKSSGFDLNHLMFIGSTFYVYSLVWLSLGTIIKNKDMAVFISLFIYTIVGLVTHFTGLFKHHNVLRVYGMVLLICVVVRLLIVDVWNMELSLRIVTFIVLGIMFISTAFISKSQKESLPISN